MRDVESLVGWVPLCRLDDHSILGVLDGRLAMDHGRARRPVDRDDPVCLLPLLERPFAEFLVVLGQREAELGLPAGSLRGWVPWPAVVRMASSSSAPYWPELAMRWMEDMPPEDLDEVALLSVGKNRVLPQSLRHRALRVLRSKRIPGR